MEETLFEGLEISDEKKVLMTETFNKAVMAKSVELLDEHVEAKVAEKEEVLKEEYAEKVSNLEDTLDGYMGSIVEEFMDENKAVYEAEIQDEKAKALLETFDKMAVILGVDMLRIQESKDDGSVEAENEKLQETITKLEEKVADMQDEIAEAKKEADKYLKAGLIQEMKSDLTIVEGEKFEKLAGMVTFGRNDEYSKNLESIVESIKSSRGTDFDKKEITIKLDENAFKPAELDTKKATDYSKYV